MELRETFTRFGVEYDVTLDTDMNGDGEVSGCWISQGRYSASLAALQATGVLTHNGDCTADLAVPDNLVEEIAQWADENGY